MAEITGKPFSILRPNGTVRIVFVAGVGSRECYAALSAHRAIFFLFSRSFLFQNYQSGVGEFRRAQSAPLGSVPGENLWKAALLRPDRLIYVEKAERATGYKLNPVWPVRQCSRSGSRLES